MTPAATAPGADGFLFGHATWIAIVRLTRDWIDNRANQTERWLGIKNIDPSRHRIGNDEHVGSVDRLPTADARAVEPDTVRENVFVVFGERGSEMLPGTGQVGEFEVHEFHVAVFDHFADVGRGFFFGHGVNTGVLR